MTECTFKSIVFILRAIQPYAVKAHMGRAVRQCFFGMIHQRDTKLVTELHNGGHEFRPYTVSDLYCANRQRRTLEVGESAWFRVTALSSEIAHMLDTLAAEVLNTTIELDSISWQVTAVLNEGHSWTGLTSDLTLGAFHMQQRPERALSFKALINSTHSALVRARNHATHSAHPKTRLTTPRSLVVGLSSKTPTIVSKPIEITARTTPSGCGRSLVWSIISLDRACGPNFSLTGVSLPCLPILNIIYWHETIMALPEPLPPHIISGIWQRFSALGAIRPLHNFRNAA